MSQADAQNAEQLEKLIITEAAAAAHLIDKCTKQFVRPAIQPPKFPSSPVVIDQYIAEIAIAVKEAVTKKLKSLYGSFFYFLLVPICISLV